MDTTHEDTSLSVQVREDLLLKGGLVDVTGTDGDTESDGLLLGLTGNVLVDGNGRVDTSALEEQSSDGSSGTFGGDKDDVDVLGWNDLGLGDQSALTLSSEFGTTHVLGVDDGETVGEVEGLALGDERSDLRPGLGLSSVREQVHDDGTPVDGLWDVEEGLSWNPSILLSLLPGLTALSDTDDDFNTVVSGVEGLTVTLGAVADHGKSVIFEVPMGDGLAKMINMRWAKSGTAPEYQTATFSRAPRFPGDIPTRYSLLQLRVWPVGSLVDDLLGTGKVERLDTSDTGSSDGVVKGNGPWGGLSEEGEAPLRWGGGLCSGSGGGSGGSGERHCDDSRCV